MTQPQNDAGEPTSSVDQILETRGDRYGTFKDNALVSQTLQHILLQHAASNANQPLQPYMVEAIAYICQKLSRIVNGDPFYDDNWVDIAGYAQLVVKELQTPQKDSNE